MPDFGAIDAADEKKSKKKKKQDDDDDEEETEGQKARREYAEKMVRSALLKNLRQPFDCLIKINAR